MKPILQHKQYIKALLAVSPKSITTILKYATSNQIKTLVEIIYNIRKLGYTKAQKKRLNRYSKLCHQILEKGINKHNKININKCRTILTKSDKQVGGFIPLLFAPLIGLAAKAAIGGAVSAGAGLATKAIIESATGQ